MQETITHTEEIYKGRVVHLFVHDVRLDNGVTSRREVVQHPGAVAMVAIDDENNVYLVRQFRLAAGRMLLEIPAGTLEPGEPPQDAAIRELQEEIGHKPGHIEPLGGLYVAPGYTTEYIHLFLATQLAPSSLAADEDEQIEVVRLPLAKAIQMIESGEIVDGKSIAGLLRVAHKLKP